MIKLISFDIFHYQLVRKDGKKIEKGKLTIDDNYILREHSSHLEILSADINLVKKHLYYTPVNLKISDYNKVIQNEQRTVIRDVGYVLLKYEGKTYETAPII